MSTLKCGTPGLTVGNIGGFRAMDVKCSREIFVVASSESICRGFNQALGRRGKTGKTRRRRTVPFHPSRSCWGKTTYRR